MPLPLIIGAAAGAAALLGVGAGVRGAVKMTDAQKRTQEANERDQRNRKRLERTNTRACSAMDALGSKELQILQSFEKFSDLIEKITNRPDFAKLELNGIKLEQFKPEDLRQASIGATVLLGGLGGAAFGTAGGFAAAGATTAAVMALGTASTGTAIASLSGAAATNATLAALGGGAIAAGGGGMALGTMVLGGATLGVGLLVGGVIFSFTGSHLSDKADEIWNEMLRAERTMQKICAHLLRLEASAREYLATLARVDDLYTASLQKMETIVEAEGKTDWRTYTPAEQDCVSRTVLLVGLLYQMCKVQIVLKSEEKDAPNRINEEAISHAISDAKTVTQSIVDGDRMKAQTPIQPPSNSVYPTHLARVFKDTCAAMDTLGVNELRILGSFSKVYELFERIVNRSAIEAKVTQSSVVEAFELREARHFALGALNLLRTLTGTLPGAASGFAAVGAFASAREVIGDDLSRDERMQASGFGESFSARSTLYYMSLSKFNIENDPADLELMTVSAQGLGILMGSVIESFFGTKDENIWDDEKKLNQICALLAELESCAKEFNTALIKVEELYVIALQNLETLVRTEGKVNFGTCTPRERKWIEHVVLLTGLLYQMCKVPLVLRISERDEFTQVNKVAIEKALEDAEKTLNALEAQK